jgi:zinc and cadmium transporter
MTQPVSLAVYAGAILVAALAGGALPLLGQLRRSDSLLSFSAGVMLGAAFLHMLPEATEEAGMGAIPFVLVGFLFLFLLERFVLVHVCAEPVGAAADVGHVHAHRGTGCAVHTMGMAAFVGLSLHTMIDGFALGAASTESAPSSATGPNTSHAPSSPRAESSASAAASAVCGMPASRNASVW